MDKERIEIIKKLKDFLRKQAIEKAILFGSYARGEAKEDSDIDLHWSSVKPTIPP